MAILAQYVDKEQRCFNGVFFLRGKLGGLVNMLTLGQYVKSSILESFQESIIINNYNNYNK